MGMLVAVALLIGVGLAFALFVHALRADDAPRAHGWIVIVPLLLLGGWLLELLIMG